MFPNSKYFENIYTAILLSGFLFYIFRAVFPPLKFLFAIFALISIALFLLRDLSRIRFFNLKNFLLPFFLILFYVLGLLISQEFYGIALKEGLNILVLIFYGIVFSVHFRAFDFKFFKWITLLLLSIGILAIIRFLSIASGFTIPFSEFLFSSPSNKFSLVSDNNYYSLYFILGIVITFYLRGKNRISAFLYFSSNTVFLINIVLCFSRRGYIGLLLIILILPLTLIRNSTKLKSTLLAFYSLISALLLFSALSIYIFRFQIYRFDIKTSIISNNLYNLNSILNKDDGVLEFNRNLWERVSDDFWSDYVAEPDNLYYNGDFRYDLDFWSFIKSKNDSVTHEIKIEDKYKYLEISRYKGVGFFQLVYHGRPIYFHKNVEYKLNFDFRIIKGEGVPFKVGWWVLDKGKRPGNLPLTVTSLSNGWNSCEAIHVFEEDHIKSLGFINSQQAGTVIQIRNISLSSVDSLQRFAYGDQILENNTDVSGSILPNALFSRRIDMWKYALQLWKTDYSWSQKIFGNGFDYLPLFGEKFNNNPGSYTYPHNPIISAFLYSGMVGGIFYIYFLYMVFWLFWKYRGELFPAFSMYVIVFLFTMFSGNSHFSVHLFAFLSFLPFIYKHYMEQKKATPMRIE